MRNLVFVLAVLMLFPISLTAGTELAAYGGWSFPYMSGAHAVEYTHFDTSINRAFNFGFSGGYFGKSFGVEGNFRRVGNQDITTRIQCDPPPGFICLDTSGVSDTSNMYIADVDLTYRWTHGKWQPYFSVGTGLAWTSYEHLEETTSGAEYVFGGGIQYGLAPFNLRVQITDRLIPNFTVLVPGPSYTKARNDVQFEAGVVFRLPELYRH